MDVYFFLNEKEVEYLKWAIIYADVRDEKTKRQLDTYVRLSGKYRSKTISEEELIQYNRLREICNFVDIITEDERPKSIEEINRRYEEGYYDDIQKDLFSDMVVQQSMDEIEDKLNLDELVRYMKEVEEQDINEPFIRDLIKSIYTEYKSDVKYERMYRLLQNINFKYINQNDMYMICFYIYKELKNPLDRYMKRSIRLLDKNMLIYLLNNLKIQFDLNDSKKK
jgi:hypothetical protein